jgi:hypothetical protein
MSEGITIRITLFYVNLKHETRFRVQGSGFRVQGLRFKVQNKNTKAIQVNPGWPYVLLLFS